MINGQLYHGASNTAGEWGHSVIVADGRRCRCGKLGCLEAYAGAPGIVQTLLEIDPNSPLDCADDQTRSIEAIAAAGAQGDPVALEVVHQTARYLSIGVGNLINILNPEVVVLGSWVAALLGPLMLEQLVRMVEEHALERPFKAARFVLSDMAHDSVSLGAATLVLEEYLAQAGRQAMRRLALKERS